MIVSATTYENFFTLRCHPDAQPEIKRLADLMRDAYRASTPTPKAAGEWHLPFVRDVDDLALPLDVQKQVSVARAARVSYLNHAGTRDIDADLVLHQRLLDAGHWSPFEHVAMATDDDAAFNNFVGWQAYRWQMEQETPSKSTVESWAPVGSWVLPLRKPPGVWHLRQSVPAKSASWLAIARQAQKIGSRAAWPIMLAAQRLEGSICGS